MPRGAPAVRCSRRALPAQVCIDIITLGLHASRKIRLSLSLSRRVRSTATFQERTPQQPSPNFVGTCVTSAMWSFHYYSSSLSFLSTVCPSCRTNAVAKSSRREVRYTESGGRRPGASPSRLILSVGIHGSRMVRQHIQYVCTFRLLSALACSPPVCHAAPAAAPAAAPPAVARLQPLRYHCEHISITANASASL